MATRKTIAKLFKGRDTAAEEKREAIALRSGVLTVKDYLAGERREGHKGSAQTARAIKQGRMTPQQYAKREARER